MEFLKNKTEKENQQEKLKKIIKINSLNDLQESYEIIIGLTSENENLKELVEEIKSLNLPLTKLKENFYREESVENFMDENLKKIFEKLKIGEREWVTLKRKIRDDSLEKIIINFYNKEEAIVHSQDITSDIRTTNYEVTLNDFENRLEEIYDFKILADKINNVETTVGIQFEELDN